MLRLDGLPSPQTLISQDEDSRTSLEFMRTLLAEEEAPSHAIITTGHIGFWEILPTALARPALPIQTQWIVYRPLHDGSLDDLVASIRQAPDRRLIADKKCYGLLRDVLQRPNSDGNAAQLVGLVADQRCNSEHTRADVTFLGQPTRLATGAARLHAETGATLWFAAVLHNKRYYETSDSTEKPFRLVLRPVDVAARSLRRAVLLRQRCPWRGHTRRLFCSVSSSDISRSTISTRSGSSNIDHQSFVTTEPNLQALEHVRWLLQQPQRRVLLLTGSSAFDSATRAALERDSPAFELERIGHGVFGVREFCQLLLRESGRERRVFGRAQLAALLLHGGLERPGASQLAATSTLQRRKGAQDLLQLFRLLESEGVTPEQYMVVADAGGEQVPRDLADKYAAYQQLLIQHNATSWDGLVMDVLMIGSVLREYTDVVLDDVQRMTPAMARLVGHLCGQPSVQSSASFSRVLLEDDECPRTQMLERQLMETAAHTTRTRGVTRVGFMTKDVHRVTLAFKKQGLPVHVDGTRLSATSSSGTPIHLFDEPGVNAVYSLLCALCYPSDSRHLYNVLRSDFFGFPAELLSWIMEKEHRSHAGLLSVIEAFVENRGQSLGTSLQQKENERQELPQAVSSQLETGLETAASFVKVIKRLQAECHNLSAIEIVQSFLEETGRLESLRSPNSPEQERASLVLADFLQELETAQNIVESAQVTFVAPYLLQLRETNLTSSAARDEVSPEATGTGPKTTTEEAGIRVLPLTAYSLESLAASVSNKEEVSKHVLVLMSMRDSKFPGRMKRLTLPLPYDLLSEPFPVQTRTEHLGECEQLAYGALTLGVYDEVVLSFAELAATSASKLKKTSYDPPHLSYSQISEYLGCPHRYYLSRVMKLDGDVSTSMMFGRALHEGVAAFAKSLASAQRNGGLTKEAKTLAAVEGEETFMRAWAGDGYGLFSSKEQASFLLERGMMALWDFIETHHGDLELQEILHVEQEFSFYVPEANVELRGVWDRIDPEESLQLKMYMYAFRQVFGEAPYGAKLQLIGGNYSEPSSGNDDKGFVHFSEQAAQEAEDIIIEVVSGLRNGDFEPKPSFAGCAFCPFAGSACHFASDDASYKRQSARQASARSS
uniref:PD-(D/E)XK endonuclease-like domain-containing protein n=1 Tax=Phytophthora ramorum TaxID=164328 RepID=H3HCF8_PHYRM